MEDKQNEDSKKKWWKAYLDEWLQMINIRKLLKSERKDSVPQVNKLTLNKKALTNQIMKTSWGGGGAWTILDQQSP